MTRSLALGTRRGRPTGRSLSVARPRISLPRRSLGLWPHRLSPTRRSAPLRGDRGPPRARLLGVRDARRPRPEQSTAPPDDFSKIREACPAFLFQGAIKAPGIQPGPALGKANEERQADRPPRPA